MERWYDKEEDILNIQIEEKEYWKSIELSDGTVIDISKDGTIIAIEIMGASKIFYNARQVIKKAKQTA